jgi:hypothetical protein
LTSRNEKFEEMVGIYNLHVDLGSLFRLNPKYDQVKCACESKGECMFCEKSLGSAVPESECSDEASTTSEPAAVSDGEQSMLKTAIFNSTKREDTLKKNTSTRSIISDSPLKKSPSCRSNYSCFKIQKDYQQEAGCNCESLVKNEGYIKVASAKLNASLEKLWDLIYNLSKSGNFYNTFVSNVEKWTGKYNFNKKSNMKSGSTIIKNRAKWLVFQIVAMAAFL